MILNNFETQGRGKFEETAISAKAYSDKATKDGVLTNEYKDAVYGSEGAKLEEMILQLLKQWVVLGNK